MKATLGEAPPRTTRRGPSRSSGTACGRSRSARPGGSAAVADAPRHHQRSTRRSAAIALELEGGARRCSTASWSPTTRRAGRASSGCRGGCTSPPRPRSASAAVDVPVTFVIFDLLHLDGESLLDVPYEERRERLDGARARRRELADARLTTAATAPAMLDAEQGAGAGGRSSPSGSLRPTGPASAAATGSR